MTKLPNGVSQSDFDAFVAKYGVPPFIGGGSPDGDGDGGGDEGGDDTGGGEGEGDQDPAAKALAAERKRADDAEKALREANKRLKGIDDQSKSELQKAQERAEAAEKERDTSLAQIRALTGQNAITNAAIAEKATKPHLIYQLVKDSVEFTDDGSVKNAAELIKQAKKDAPELFGISNGNQGAGAGGDEAGSDMNASIRRMAGRAN